MEHVIILVHANLDTPFAANDGTQILNDTYVFFFTEKFETSIICNKHIYLQSKIYLLSVLVYKYIAPITLFLETDHSRTAQQINLLLV